MTDNEPHLITFSFEAQVIVNAENRDEAERKFRRRWRRYVRRAKPAEIEVLTVLRGRRRENELKP